MFYVFFCVQNNVVWLQIFIKHVVIVWVVFVFFFVWGGWQLVLLLGEKKTWRTCDLQRKHLYY